MNQLLIAVAVLVVAIAVGAVLRRRRSVDAADPAGVRCPGAARPGRLRCADAPWLVAVFSSATCTTCADVVRKAKVLPCAEVAVVDVEYCSRDRRCTASTTIDAVPLAVVADRAGVVAGPASSARCRQPTCGRPSPRFVTRDPATEPHHGHGPRPLICREAKPATPPAAVQGQPAQARKSADAA